MTKVELITKELGKNLLVQIEKASSICILTSFVMKSGVNFLKDALKAAAIRGADIKICTGDYLYVTQPEGLEALHAIDERIQIRLWKSNGISFHPKAYLFQDKEQECLYIGSSNLSKSALNQGVEWNLSVSNDQQVFAKALDQFLNVFYADQTISLNKETLKDYKEKYEEYHKKNPNLAKTWSKMEELDLMLPSQKDEPSLQEVIKETPIEYGNPTTICTGGSIRGIK